MGPCKSAKHFRALYVNMLYCRLIYILSILCVRLTIKVKVGIPESFKVGWYPPPKKKLGRVTLISLTNRFISVAQPPKLSFGPNVCFPCLDSHSSASSFCPLCALCVFRTRSGLITLDTCS